MAKGRYEEWLTDEGLIQIEGWARDGLTMEQIAHNLGISVVTLRDWRKKYPSIFTALKKGRDVADREVENALHKSATGFYYDEVTTERRKDGSMCEVRRVRKYQLPNTTAQIFWLKNRKPAEWRDKRNIEMSGEVKNPVQVYLPDNGHGADT